MELEIKTTKPSQIIWLFRQSSFESKHSFSSSLDVNEDLKEGIVNLGTYQVLRQKCKAKDENENEVQTNLDTKIAKGFLLNLIEWNSRIMSISNKLMSCGQYRVAPPVFETGVSDRGITQEQVDHGQVIGGGYCRGIQDHDEEDDEEEEIMGVVEKPSRIKNLLYLILTVSSLILCFLPRVYGEKIPNLFVPCPWLFYGFNFALMLAASASLLSIDAVSNIKKVTRCFSYLAIVSILTALALFLFSSFLWARSLWDI